MSCMSYIVVSNIKDSTTLRIIGYRVVCINNNKVFDVKSDTLLENIRKAPSSFLNVGINMFNDLVFGTESGTSNDLPSLTSTGRRLLDTDRLTVAMTDRRGNAISYNAHGEKEVVQAKVYLLGLKSFTNARVESGMLRGYFKVDILDRNYFKKLGMPVPNLYSMSLCN